MADFWLWIPTGSWPGSWPRRSAKLSGELCPLPVTRSRTLFADGAVCVLITGRFAKTDPEGLRTHSRRTIQLKSMQDVLADYQRPPAPILLGVVSRSKTVLRWASTLLSSLGFSPDAVLFRNPERSGWREGLHACHLIGADIVSAQELGSKSKIVKLRIVSDEFLAELKGPAPCLGQTYTRMAAVRTP